MNIIRKEPAVVLSLLATIIVGASQQIVGSGIVNGAGLDVLNLVISVVPVIAGILTRSLVSPVSTAPATPPSA